MKDSIDPGKLLDQARDMAGDRAYARGQEYAEAGRVILETARPGSVDALVHGNQTYSVRLHWRNGLLDGDCDCPVGTGGEFCKHQVATALVWTGQAGDADAGAPKPRGKRAAKTARKVSPQDDQAQLQAWLESQDRPALHALVLDLAGRDSDTWRSLLTRARFASASPDSLRKAVGDLIGRKRFLDYRAVHAYARRLETLVELLREVRQRDLLAALDLCQYALLRLIPIYAESDDSGGRLGEAMADLGYLFRETAQAARPEPDAFAKTWLKLRLADRWGLISALKDYANLFGRRGLDRLETQAQRMLEALPVPKDRIEAHGSDRFALDDLLKELAALGGDAESLLARKAREAREPWDFLQLAELYQDHGRERQAMLALEQGVQTHPRDLRLIDRLAETRERDGFPEEALALRWRGFESAPAEATWLALRHSAVGTGNWPHWREKALAHVAARHGIAPPQRNALLIGLHLLEDDIAAAWRIADTASLPLHTWQQLAPRLEASEPESALRAYRTLVQACVQRGNRQGYAEALRWLQCMLPVHQRLKSESAFAAYLDTLRQDYRAKRSFMEMLAEFEAR